MDKDLKIVFYQHCQSLVQERIANIQAAMATAQAAANENTKSSAGDKYETGRAMMQMEKVKAAERLSTALKLEKVLSEINPEQAHSAVELGSLLETPRGYFFISVPLGKVKADNQQFWAISPVSPVGSLMMGKSKGDKFSFNGQEFEVLGVC